ncbi:MAG: hypothetical protein HY645_13505 [Acidobacteria bacterium]|nr:hypothetical protein [Acidobacteriota bacterium]
MQEWSKESLGLKIGDVIEWQDEALPGPNGILVAPGRKGKVVQLLDGAFLDVVSGSIPPGAIVEFKGGFRLMIDSRAKFRKVL